MGFFENVESSLQHQYHTGAAIGRDISHASSVIQAKLDDVLRAIAQIRQDYERRLQQVETAHRAALQKATTLEAQVKSWDDLNQEKNRIKIELNRTVAEYLQAADDYRTDIRKLEGSLKQSEAEKLSLSEELRLERQRREAAEGKIVKAAEQVLSLSEELRLEREASRKKTE